MTSVTLTYIQKSWHLGSVHPLCKVNISAQLRKFPSLDTERIQNFIYYPIMTKHDLDLDLRYRADRKLLTGGRTTRDIV